MTRLAAALSVGGVALLTAACLWQDPFVETQAVDPRLAVTPPPRDQAGNRAASPVAGVPRAEANPRPESLPDAAPQATVTGAADPPPREGVVPPAEPAPGVPAPVANETPTTPAQPRLPEQWRMPPTKVVPIHGLSVVFPAVVPAAAGMPAHLCLTLPVGSRVVSPGLAELGAAVASDLRLPRRVGGSLRGALARLGASLETSVAPGATTFSITCAPEAWKQALATLAENLAQPVEPDVPMDAFDAVRTALALRLARAASADPLLSVVGRVCQTSALAPAELVSDVSQRTAAEVGVLQRTRYRAAGALLTLWLPGVPSTGIGAAAETALSPWLDHAVQVVPESFVASPPLESGVFWAPRDGAVEVALVWPALPVEQALAAEMAVLYECLSHDGMGGRLGIAIEALVGRDVLFDRAASRALDHVVLRARANGPVVMPLYEALSEVLNSFRLKPPAGEEVREAASRARARWLERLASPHEWSRLVAWLTYHRASPDVLAEILDRLSAPEQLEIVRAIPNFVGATLSLAVVGGEPPAEAAKRVQVLSDVSVATERVQRVVPAADRAAAEARAKQRLELAVAAAGGEAVLRAVTGYREVALLRSDVGPPCHAEVEFDASGKLRELRHILTSEIVTEIAAGSGLERCGAEQVPLPVDEVKARLDQAAQHPLMLLARWVRQEIVFRQVAVRLVDGREYAVLEEVTELRDPLRVVIDTGSHLVRSLEARTWLPESGATLVTEEFGDYRPVKGGLRAPFSRSRTTDDADLPLRIQVESFAAHPAR